MHCFVGGTAFVLAPTCSIGRQACRFVSNLPIAEAAQCPLMVSAQRVSFSLVQRFAIIAEWVSWNPLPSNIAPYNKPPSAAYMMNCFTKTPFVLVVLLSTSTLPTVSAQPLNDRPIEDDVFYHFMPISWRDSDNDAQRFGDFNGMTASLDYLEELGVTAVWMNPIFPSPAYHGYQHGPGDQVNNRFGTETEFLNFVDAAHQRGIKVFLDFVVYGISQDSVWFQSAANNPSSPFDTWLAFENGSNTNYLGSVYNSWNGASVGFIHWNLDNFDASDLVTSWSQHWLDPNNDGDPSDGIDGYRLDHVWAQYPNGPNGWGYNIDWWIDWRNALRSVKPGVFIFAEQADWGSTGANLLPAFDASMTKPWEFAVRDALKFENANNLYSQTQATLAALPAGKQFMGIIGDHDVDRLSSVIGTSFEKGKAAAAVLLTAPFTPMIYHGDEIGMTGVKANYGSDANDIPFREPFKWNAVAGPPMSNYWVLNNQAFNNAFSSNNDGRSVEEQSGVPGSLLEAYKQLIATRRDHIALRRGEYLPISASSSQVWSFIRHQPNEETLLIAINVGSQPQNAALNLGEFAIPNGTSSVFDIINGAGLSKLTDANKASYGVNLAGYGYRILSVNVEPPAPDVNALTGFEIQNRFVPADLIATQDNETGLGDNISELNQLFVKYESDGLRVAVTGNLATDGTGLAIAFDTVPGGQNVLDMSQLSPPPAGPNQLTSTQFDAGFAPDEIVFINTFGGNIYVDQYSLPTDTTATKIYRGNGTVNDGDGFLNGGNNPNQMQVALNNTNALGVTDSSAADAATATNGFEMKIPYDDIDLVSGGEFKIMAFVLQSNGSVSNQVLPGLGGGVPNLGLAPNFAMLTGNQYAAVAPTTSVFGDIDADGDVDITDAALLANVLLGIETDANRLVASDLNNDGDLDGRDVQAFLDVVVTP